MRWLLPCLLMLSLPFVQAAESTTVEVEIREWRVPWDNTRPRDPFVDQQDQVWFCGQAGNYIAYLEPTTGDFKRYPLEPGSHPHNLIVDATGHVWYAGNRNAHIGRLNPDNGQITRFPTPSPKAQDPHTLVFNQTGDIWFTAQWGNAIGRLTATGQLDVIELPLSRSRPYGIKIDSDDRPWVVLFGTNKLATINPQTLALQVIDLPRNETRPRRIEISSDGSIWYVDYAGGILGRYDPTSKQFKEWPLPSGSSARPYGTAIDSQDRLWIVETGVYPNRLVGFDPVGERFFSNTVIPSGGGSVRHMYYHPPSNEIWFGTDTNYIGRTKLN